MPNQLIPPPEFAPPTVKHLPLKRRIELWSELVDENEALVRAGLCRKIGSGGDLKAAYRQWYARQMDDHDRRQAALVENLSRREARHGR